MPTKEQVEGKLKEVYDPELHIDIFTLELIYDIKIEPKIVKITMTFTTPFCPYGPALIRDVETKVKELDSIEEVEVEVVFEPPWKPSDELLDMMAMGVK